jgi:formiminotetrahydrofolate cyclodeaminase
MISEASTTALIELPTKVLLDKFGAGEHVPGSGSAAALVGILAGKLVLTVSSLTKQRDEYASVWQQIEYVEQQVLGRLEPSLTDEFQRDAEIFDRVILARRGRQAAQDPLERKRLNNEARELLKPATEMPISICRECLKVAELGLVMFDVGFQPARGDSGTAVSVALGGALSALCIAYLNLTAFRAGEWARGARTECNELLAEFRKILLELLSRVSSLQSEGSEEMQDLQLQLPLN